MANRVNVVLDVKDDGSAVIMRFKQHVNSLGGSFNRAGGQAQGLGRNLTGSMAAGVVAGNAVIATIGAIGAAAGAASRAVAGLFADYARTQQEGILAAGSVMGALNVSYDEARGIIRGFTSELAQQTSLYGADLAKAQDAANVGLDDLLKVFTDAGMQQGAAAERSAKLFSKLQAVAGNDLTNMQLSQVVPNLLEGELDASKDFFNSQIVNYMNDYLKKVGKTIDNANPEERIKALEYALEKKLPDEVVAKMQGSINGIMASFKNAFFNIDTGILALDRDLDPKKAGVQSVGASFTRLVKKIFGTNGLFANVGKILNALGIDNTAVLDTMAAAIGRLGLWLDKVNRVLGGLALRFNLTELVSGQQLNLGDLIGPIFSGLRSLAENAVKGLTGWINGAVDQVLAWFKNMGGSDGAAEAGMKAGEELAKAVDWAIRTVGTYISSIDWGDVVTLLWNGVKNAFSFLAGLVVSYTATIVPLTVNLIGDALKQLASAVAEGIRRLASLDFFSGASRQTAMNSGQATTRGPVISPTAMGAPPPPTASGSGASPSGDVVTTRYQGNVPINTPSMLQAMLRERSAAPIDSDLAVANTSELILNRRQQTQLSGNLAQLGGGRPAPGPVTINVHSYAADAKAVAREVAAILAQEWAEYDHHFVTGVVV